VKLGPQIAAPSVNCPKCCRNFVPTQQKAHFKSILSSEGQTVTCWGFWLGGGLFFALHRCPNHFKVWRLSPHPRRQPCPRWGGGWWWQSPSGAGAAGAVVAGGTLSTPPHVWPGLVGVEVGLWEGSVQLCLFANRLLFPTRKAIWIRTACLAAAQRFSLKPAGSRWINRTQRYRLNPVHRSCFW